MNSDVESFAARVERLETQDRVLKRLVGAQFVLLVAVAVLAIGALRVSRPGTIVTDHLVLRDQAGRQGADLSFDMDGQASLHLFGLGDEQGVNSTLTAQSLELHFHTSSSSLSDGGFFTFDEKGNQIIGLGGPVGAAPVLRMWGSNRQEIWLSAAHEDGPTIGMSDEAGFEAHLGSVELTTSRTGDQHKTSAASLTLVGKDGKVLWSAP